MRTLLICHHDAPLDRVGLVRWLASFSDLAGIVEIREPTRRVARRIRRELRRIGPLRFLDVLAFRLWRRVALAGEERAWERGALEALCGRYPEAPGVPVHTTADPNAPATREFIAGARPDLVIARCKTLLREEVFSIPPVGTFVLHPGICPEYRNAHGCFWALAADDAGKVGMTLLKVDRGVDTGPVYGCYSCAFDASRESPMVIQQRVVTENLEPLERRLKEIAAGGAAPLDTTGRPSREWGQPWLSAYVRYRRRERGKR